MQDTSHRAAPETPDMPGTHVHTCLYLYALKLIYLLSEQALVALRSVSFFLRK